MNGYNGTNRARTTLMAPAALQKHFPDVLKASDGAHRKGALLHDVEKRYGCCNGRCKQTVNTLGIVFDGKTPRTRQGQGGTSPHPQQPE